MIGYFLHLPYFSLRKIGLLWDKGAAEQLLQMDILQTIGYSLLISAILWIFFKRKFLYILFIWGLFDLFVNFYPVNISNTFFKFFFSSTLSPFPLFPWSFYFILGVFASKYIKRFNLFIFSSSILIASIQFFKSGYEFERLADIGKVIILLQLCQAFLNKIPHFFKGFMRASRESLFLYISHIMIVYGSVLSKGLSHYIGENLNFYEFFSIFLLIIITLYLAAYFINIMREKEYTLFLLTKNSIYLIFWIEFFKSRW